MESLYLLIAVSMVFVGASIALLLWAINAGQLDDLDGAGGQVIDDDKADTPGS